MDIQVVELFADITYAYQARMKSPEHIGRSGLSHFQVQTLAFFARWPGTKPSQLVVRSGRDKAQVTRVIREMEHEGLVKRAADSIDRRASRIFLTDKGRHVYDLLNEKRRAWVEQMLEPLDAGEREELFSLLTRVRSGLGDTAAP